MSRIGAMRRGKNRPVTVNLRRNRRQGEVEGRTSFALTFLRNSLHLGPTVLDSKFWSELMLSPLSS